MEQRKNKKMLLLVGILIAIIGVSFAYFIVSSLIRGEGSKGVMTTANINGATIDIEGTIEFNDLDILPGHKTISGIKLTATGNNELIPYNLIWEGTNTINTALKYTVYKTNTEVNPSATCNKIRGTKGGASISYEECEITKLNELGTPISNGTILKNSEKEILASDEFITASTTGNIVYYYVILEYPNLDEPQNIDIGGTFNGIVKVEKSDANADIIVEATYIKQEDGTYKETQEIPTSGYILNDQSSCSNSATPVWEENTLLVNNLTAKGTVCKLYFEEYSAIDKIIGDTTGIEEKTEFTGIATSTDTGIYTAPDDYGTSYYFRGLEGSLNNWVKFAGSYWRIIRINGNGTVRMIYQGVANGNISSSNKTGTTTSIGKSMYNHTYNDNAYVGYMMGIPLNGTAQTENQTSVNSTSYEQAHANTYDSDAKIQVDNWYKAHIEDKGLSKYIDMNIGFCNDRVIDKTIYTGDGYGTQNTGYASWGRARQKGGMKLTQTPTLQCLNKERDLFTLNSTNTENKGNKRLTYPVGLITSDEIVFAGGFGTYDNSMYYLYTNQNYWTMSPSYHGDNRAFVFYVHSNGFHYSDNNGVANVLGLRPVLNLRADTVLTGTGSETDPFIVVGGNS